MLPRPPAATATADFIITYHGTVATLDILSRACLSWVEENVPVEPWQRIGASAICIDPRIADELRSALSEAGFRDRDALAGER
jgi:hypothetical protein